MAKHRRDRRIIDRRDKSVIYHVWWFDRSEHLVEWRNADEVGQLVTALQQRVVSGEVREFRLSRV